MAYFCRGLWNRFFFFLFFLTSFKGLLKTLTHIQKNMQQKLYVVHKASNIIHSLMRCLLISELAQRTAIQQVLKMNTPGTETLNGRMRTQSLQSQRKALRNPHPRYPVFIHTFGNPRFTPCVLIQSSTISALHHWPPYWVPYISPGPPRIQSSSSS